MRLPTDFAHRTSITAHSTYLKSNLRAIEFALGRVRLTLVNNTRGAKTDFTAKMQQKECENALADSFRASDKHHCTHDLPNNRRVIAFAVGRVWLTLVTHTRGATTDFTAKEQQKRV